MRPRVAIQLLNACNVMQLECQQFLQRARAAGCTSACAMQAMGKTAAANSPAGHSYVYQSLSTRLYSVTNGATQQWGLCQLQTARAVGCSNSTVQRQSARAYSEDLRVVVSEISEQEYHHLADELLEQLQEKLEEFIEDQSVEGGDVEHAQGVLTVRLGHHGTYVINKQTPNKQIWLSSPVSGPFRYDYHEGKWVYHRDGRELLRQLEQEFSSLLGSSPDLSGIC